MQLPKVKFIVLYMLILLLLIWILLVKMVIFHYQLMRKFNRIEALLKTVMFLYRDIKGRRENLSPLFVIGGVFGIENPFFSNVINVSDGKLNINSIKSVLNMMQEEKEFVKVGLVNGIFNNETDIISELDAKDVGEVFNEIIDDMKKTYE